MSAEDFEFAVRITDQMSWGLAKADFEFMIELEPEGCFVLLHDSERVGIATTVSFGRVGWFGNLIVSPEKQRKGGGSFLVRHALEYLADKNVRTVGLYAYTEKIPFYTALGFKYDSDFIALKGKGASSSSHCVDVREATNKDINEIIDLDKACFGASRKKLLEPILRDTDNFCYVSTENGRLSGFTVAKVYQGMVELGPLVSTKELSDIAIGLLAAALSRSNDFEVTTCVPKSEASILNMLTRTGFTEKFRVARMFFGPSVTGDCVYAAESLERG